MNQLNNIRKKIDKIDESIIKLLRKRINLCIKAKNIKKSSKKDIKRTHQIIKNIKNQSKENNININFSVPLYKKILDYCLKQQNK